MIRGGSPQLLLALRKAAMSSAVSPDILARTRMCLTIADVVAPSAIVCPGLGTARKLPGVRLCLAIGALGRGKLGKPKTECEDQRGKWKWRNLHGDPFQKPNATWA